MITNCVDGARCSFQRPDCRTFSRPRAANTGSCGASFLTLVGSEWRRQVRSAHPMSPSPAPRVATHQRSGSSIARNRRLSCLLGQGFLVLTLAGPAKRRFKYCATGPNQVARPSRRVTPVHLSTLQPKIRTQVWDPAPGWDPYQRRWYSKVRHL